MIVSETNRYARQVLTSEGHGEREWSTNPEELLAYMGFMMLMGINIKPELRDYWSTDEALYYKQVADPISRQRFEEITRYLHFVDNGILPSRGEPFFSQLQKVYKKSITSHNSLHLNYYRYNQSLTYLHLNYGILMNNSLLTRR